MACTTAMSILQMLVYFAVGRRTLLDRRPSLPWIGRDRRLHVPNHPPVVEALEVFHRVLALDHQPAVRVLDDARLVDVIVPHYLHDVARPVRLLSTHVSVAPTYYTFPPDAGGVAPLSRVT